MKRLVCYFVAVPFWFGSTSIDAPFANRSAICSGPARRTSKTVRCLFIPNRPRWGSSILNRSTRSFLLLHWNSSLSLCCNCHYVWRVGLLGRIKSPIIFEQKKVYNGRQQLHKNNEEAGEIREAGKQREKTATFARYLFLLGDSTWWCSPFCTTYVTLETAASRTPHCCLADSCVMALICGASGNDDDSTFVLTFSPLLY